MEPYTDNDKIFSRKVKEKANRMLKAQHENKRSAWLGLGVFGMVGWSIVVPTLVGITAGVWLDNAFEQTFSWTLSLLFIGLVIGCVIAWMWINRERKHIYQNNKNKNE